MRVKSTDGVPGDRAESALTEPGRTSSLLLIADPGVPAALAERIADSLADELAEPVNSSPRWDISVRAKPFLPDEHATFREVIESVNPSGEDAEVIVYLTDLPRREHTLPVIADVSLEHRFALVSVPGIGAAFVTRRVRDVVLLVIGEVTGQPELASERVKRLPRTQLPGTVRYFAPRGFRRVRLLAGMVRANRPWRLATGLSRVLVGAFATGALGLVTSTVWSFADTMGPWRLATATVLSIGAMMAWLILDHELWERPKSSTERDRARLYNLSTLITLLIGVAVQYVALFFLLLVAAGVSLPPGLLAREVGHPTGVASYFLLAWLLASIATVGGALGSGLEDDEVVRAAAYGARQRQRFDQSS